MSTLAELGDAGIGSSVHYRPLHLLTWYRDTYGYRPQDLPVATAAYERLLSLPVYPDLEPAGVDRVVDTLRSVLDRHRR